MTRRGGDTEHNTTTKAHDGNPSKQKQTEPGKGKGGARQDVTSLNSPEGVFL